MRVGDDGAGTGRHEASREVVDPLLGDRQRRRGHARLGVARRVAEVRQDHDRVRGELDGALEIGLAVVGRVRIALARDGIEPEAVLPVGHEGRRIRAGEAVPVTHVDDDVRALERRLRGRPRGVRAVHLHDVGRVLDGGRVDRIHVGPVGIGGRVGRADDQHDLRARCGRRGRGDGRRRGDAREGEQAGDKQGNQTAHGAGTPVSGEAGQPWAPDGPGSIDRSASPPPTIGLPARAVRCGPMR